MKTNHNLSIPDRYLEKKNMKVGTHTQKLQKEKALVEKSGHSGCVRESWGVKQREQKASEFVT